MTSDLNHNKLRDEGGSNSDLDELVADYLDRLNSGESLDAFDILGEQPDLGSEILRGLRAFLELESDNQPLGTLGDYTLRRQIGRGGMGVVHLGRDEDLGREVAVKVLGTRLASNEEALRRFIEEAQIAGQLQHPGIVPVYDLGQRGEDPYFTMKLVKGET